MTFRSVWRTVREFLFTKASKEFLIFVFFLALSGVFWLSLTLNETYEQEFAVPISVVGVPKNAVLTSDEVDTIRVTIRDKGIVLVTYKYGEALKRIEFPFRNYTHNNGTGQIPISEIQKRIYQNLVSSSKITAIKPEKMEFYYSYGSKKQVPVRWSGRVIPEELYFISRVSYEPDSVTIFASDDKLDSISMVYTEQLNYVNFRDTLSVDCNLAKLRGVKAVPDHIRVKFFTDVLTEERISGIPIVGINMPEGKVLRTFPAKTSVSFVAGVSVYRNLKPEDFTIIVDYDEIRRNPSEKCRIYLKKVPSGISRAKLETSMVDYLIESQE
ncbi:MAG: YbbR-like domain-containing protein [Prevotella sp.]|nr:YbbR-like domain-containing protein [Prevotella sp.]MBQ9648849.1 YbbR-like domain-containing protein [Prevotella sp.]